MFPVTDDNHKALQRSSGHFFFGSLIVPKKEVSARKTTLSPAEISYASGKVPIDEMKVFEKKTNKAKKLEQSMIKD